MMNRRSFLAALAGGIHGARDGLAIREARKLDLPLEELDDEDELFATAIRFEAPSGPPLCIIDHDRFTIFADGQVFHPRAFRMSYLSPEAPRMAWENAAAELTVADPDLGLYGHLAPIHDLEHTLSILSMDPAGQNAKLEVGPFSFIVEALSGGVDAPWVSRTGMPETRVRIRLPIARPPAHVPMVPHSFPGLFGAPPTA